jgi:hypothetical protein
MTWGIGKGNRITRKAIAHALNAVLLATALAAMAKARDGPLVLEPDGRVISLVPYAPNILRITISTDASAAYEDGAGSSPGFTGTRPRSSSVRKALRSGASQMQL